MIEVAKQAAKKAGKVILSLRKKRLKVKRKGVASDIVTWADLVSEKIILDLLKSKYPDHNFLSEEIGREDNGSRYWWFIDPIDGTISYKAGLGGFGVSIGLLKDLKPFMGVIYQPAFDKLLWGRVGKKAFLNGKETRVRKESKLSNSLVGLVLGHTGDRTKEIKNFLLPLAEKVRYPLVSEFAAYNLANLASGLIDAYIHRAYPWDLAAGTAIVEAAGGKVTDVDGKKPNWEDKMISLLASNGRIHNKLLKLIKK